ncbi:MAG: hypothetical protein HC925_01775 [Coleofasciculaceae cyanobacterium SM2_3_26]|nr:hypothetical protein [Coleofasciculaceae cyanobacterium SM2_3_26]
MQGFELANGNWQGIVTANRIAIAPLIAAGVVPEGVQIPNDAALTTAQLNVSGTLSPDPNTLQASGTGNPASGIRQPECHGHRFNRRTLAGIRDGDRLQLSQVVPDLRGALNSQLNASGTLADLSPTGIRFDGVFNFSQIPIGAAFLDRLEIPSFAPEKLSPYLDNSLTASVAWNGSALTLREVTSPAGFRVAGTVGVDFNRSLPITTLDLNVAQRNYDLATLPVALPNDATPVQGTLDFEGRVTGTATDPRIAGALQLQELIVGGTAFDPVLTGTVAASLQAVDVDLRGNQRDRIALNAAKTPAGSPLPYAPRSLEVRRGDAIAVGSCQVEIFPCPNFALTVENFDLALLEPILPVRGTLNANLNANFRQLVVSGSTQVNQPWLQSPIGPVEAHAVEADFRYGDGVLQLSQARLLQGGTWWRDRPPVNTCSVGQWTFATSTTQNLTVSCKLCGAISRTCWRSCGLMTFQILAS